MIRKLAVTGGLSIGLIISVILERNLETKHIATFIFAIVISAYWFAEFIYSYVLFRLGYKDEYTYFKAKLVNEKDIPINIIENNNKLYYKKFKKSMLKASFLEFSKILVAFGLFIAFLTALTI